jgi:zinc-ribbon domain
MSTNSATPPTAKVLLGCSKCGASLPDEAQFCLKCGKPVSSSPKTPVVVEPPAVEIARPRRKRRWLLWMLLVILAGVILWALISDSTGAQQVQEFVGFKQDRVILDSAFSVGPHTFRYYKFALPEGSVNVAVVGQFTSAADNQGAGNRKSQLSDKNKNQASDNDNGIEAYVLTEPAFTVWQNGYATSSLYDSGSVTDGTVQTDIPAGAGIYYLVFSNKSAPKTPKTVHATVLLRYKSWLPNWVRRMKGRFLDWVGLS